MRLTVISWLGVCWMNLDDLVNLGLEVPWMSLAIFVV